MARPRKPNPGTGILGAILGGVLGGPVGAAAGGVVGTVVGGDKLPLDEALRTSLQSTLGLTLVRLDWTSKFSLSFLVQDRHRAFWVFNAAIPVRLDLTAEKLEDKLYDAAMLQAREWRFKNMSRA